MRKFILSIVLVVAAGCCADNIEVSRIWDENYSAFPSIVEFHGKYYVAFREASSHIFDENGNADGKARILVSNNGRRWKSVALIEKPGTDLRDPKLSVTPDGRLMVTLGGSHGTIYDFDPSTDKSPRASIYLARIPKKLL